MNDLSERDTAAMLVRLGSATLGESGAARMAPRLRPVWSGAAVAARAYPVRCTPGDNLAMHVALTTAPTGSVLCVDVGDERELGYWGEVMMTASTARGIVGLVIDGGVRDVAALRSHQFPVFSTGVALTGATKVNTGTVGASASVGDIEVQAGDWVVGDVDGVVVVRSADAASVLQAGLAREAKEIGMFASVKAGSTTVELLDLDASLIEVVNDGKRGQ